MSHTFSDGQIVCPYEPSHIICRIRAIPHLAKCRKQHPNLTDKILICTYNQAHHIPLDEMPQHLKACKEYSAAQYQSFDTFVPYKTIPKSKHPIEENEPDISENPDVDEWL